MLPADKDNSFVVIDTRDSKKKKMSDILQDECLKPTASSQQHIGNYKTLNAIFLTSRTNRTENHTTGKIQSDNQKFTIQMYRLDQ